MAAAQCKNTKSWGFLLLQRIVKIQNFKTLKKEKFILIPDSVTRKKHFFFFNKEVDPLAWI